MTTCGACIVQPNQPRLSAPQLPPPPRQPRVHTESCFWMALCNAVMVFYWMMGNRLRRPKKLDEDETRLSETNQQIKWLPRATSAEPDIGTGKTGDKGIAN